MRPKLQYMSLGAAVTELQTKLNKLLPAVLPPLKVDGKFGDKTLARVKEFQRTRGLVADGVVGAKTWAAIDGLAPPNPQAPAATSKPLNNPHQEALAKNFGVRLGNLIKCNEGSVYGSFRCNQALVATVDECLPNVNIPTFGKCKSTNHPAYGQVSNPWQGAGMDLVFHAMCTPAPVGGWQTKDGGVDPKTGRRRLIRGAMCLCKYGGTIKVP